ncbi:MAG: hypothetical protein N2C14_15425 [Planctomycetales bacterium]
MVVEGVGGWEATEQEFCEVARMKWVHGDSQSTMEFVDLKYSLWPLFAADCVERVLAVIEKEYPWDKRPRQVIEAARKFAVAEISATTLQAGKGTNRRSQNAMLAVALVARTVQEARAACAANAEARRSATARAAGWAAKAAYAAAWAATDASDADDVGDDARKGEFRWQLVRLAEYKLWGQAVSLWNGE